MFQPHLVHHNIRFSMLQTSFRAAFAFQTGMITVPATRLSALGLPNSPKHDAHSPARPGMSGYGQAGHEH
jgi:hypothetical protein